MALEIGKLAKGLSYEEYAATPGLRASDLKIMKRSPAHWKFKQPESEPSDALEFGRLFHSAIENSDAFLKRMVVAPKFDKRTKMGKQEWADWFASVADDSVVIKEDWATDLAGMLNAIHGHSRVKNIVKEGVSETSLLVQDPDTGVMLKCRPDFITERGHLIDFKTTRDAHPSFFMRQIFSSRSGSPFYVLAAAHYVHCLKIAGICKSESMTLIAVEKTAPYGVWVYPLDIGCLAVGEQWRAMLTQQYAECLDAQSWPCYPETITGVVPPQWAEVPEMDEVGHE